MSPEGFIQPGLFEDLQSKIDDDGRVRDVSDAIVYVYVLYVLT